MSGVIFGFHIWEGAVGTSLKCQKYLMEYLMGRDCEFIYCSKFLPNLVSFKKLGMVRNGTFLGLET